MYPYPLGRRWIKCVPARIGWGYDRIMTFYAVLLSICDLNILQLIKPGVNLRNFKLALARHLPAAFGVMALNHDRSQEKFPGVVSWFENNVLFPYAGQTMGEY